MLRDSTHRMNAPDPDDLPDAQPQHAHAGARRRGRLTIFFGAAAGVGKTSAMLRAARRRAQERVDVVVGSVETHRRDETAALLDGLDLLPPAPLDHRGGTFTEFDLDAALARRPQLIVVDELAHSNPPGSRHPKRWHDVRALLDAGIDVYTTLNVQHLESLADGVGRIAGVRVNETVPDRLFDDADEVTLVELAPDELLGRLRDRQPSLPQPFFSKGNLIALRELALRRLADRNGAAKDGHRSSPPSQVRERLLACIGPGPDAEAVVREAARLAASLGARWYAVHVETPKLQRRSGARRESALAALKLAAGLGAEATRLAGDDAAATLGGYARLRGVSRLVVGGAARAGLARWRRPFGERVAQHAGDVDLIRVMRASAHGSADAGPANGGAGGGRAPAPRRSPLRAYAWALAICAGVTLVASRLSGRIDLTNLVMLYLLGVIFAAAKLGRGPGVLLSFASVAAFDFFFVPPTLSLTVSDTQYLLTFAGMLLTSLVISHLTSSLRREASVAQRREQRTGAMYAMARDLAAVLTVEQIVATGSRHVSDVFGARVAILLPDADDRVRPAAVEADPRTALDARQLDLDIGQWVYDRRLPAGPGTDVLPAAAARYVPLNAPVRARGVLAVLVREGRDGRERPEPGQQRMLDAFAAQIALALERVHYVDVARDALVGIESERLRNSLLSAISHDLRTPLTTIVGFASMLARTRDAAKAGANPAAGADADADADEQTGELVDAIHEEALRMTGIVTNLLDMARLQSGSVKLNRQWTPLEETVGAALAACRRVLAAHPVRVALEPGLPLLNVDAVLMERLFANLLENAAKYTPPGTPVEIGARRVVDDDGRAFVRVAIDDRGPGLPPGMEARVFDKFTRGDAESAQPGIGLGLAICRAIVDAHGGTIGAAGVGAASIGAADGRAEGASFWFTLPVGTPPPLPLDVADDPVDPANAPDVPAPKPAHE
ncbi:two-component system, OmpR family, sensor histidine kinase KdpD [Paraburkholderia caballeronis]|uniref:histidine kinase n=2 Tax=Paraburkholderia caballeronis TaxID=416943 RepID=A0A1H7T7W8_9BURK|nr:two-component system sensor histidine kinase KdpD [Paraburkholderia caballeronis]PXW96783.1 two-component system sensor histidine kinase KdpD [Paraburkholderia caballeronis]RAJ93410.1 two-component system sensor histidine kinase KdpD [Paraburkholderia caballeronis]SEC70483.1 two-component system, OmpR family, sensor histidine kinase KdpD [Paraburkholderia caballeronis]SEL80818.1 two-component system, OmpR family, sensor histidine kinase KdpD [Paraburkholderia caballeronis]